MLETERLVLAPPSLTDFEDSYAMSSDPDVAQFIGAKPATRESAWTMLLRSIGHWSVFGYGIFTVREKENGRFVGEVGLAHFSRGLGELFDPFPEAAWVLATSSHGKGFATEAVVAAHDWMMRQHRPIRTVCIIHPDNAASVRIATKLGYTSCGHAEYRDASPIMFERL
jgi:RimJ/RimL family protein N-acetyltransferase